MSAQMTTLSNTMYALATSGALSLKEAVHTLQNEMQIRTLAQTLQRFAQGRELRPLLVDGLIRNHPQAKRDSVERKVRNWLGNASPAVDKGTAIELCFLLGLSLEQADQLVAYISGESFHWRDPEEIVYIYALTHGMTYLDAQALLARADVSPRGKEPPADQPMSFTPVVRQEVESLKTTEELLDYLREARSRLGRYHNTAYELFMQWIALLEKPEIDDEMSDVVSESKMNVREILEQYLFRKWIPQYPSDKAGAQTAGAKAALSAVQRDVWMNWPEESVLSRMKNRSADVSRKVLMLLFLATNGEGREDPEEDEELEEPSRDEVFLDLYLRMNRMLEGCGFSRLDPRTPFDWMTLYCMCVDDVSDTDAEMTRFLQALFRNGDGAQEGEAPADIL